MIEGNALAARNRQFTEIEKTLERNVTRSPSVVTQPIRVDVAENDVSGVTVETGWRDIISNAILY